MQYEVIEIKTVQTEKEGQLSFFEGEKTFPFSIKRIYYIHHVPAEARRGAHAHKTLEQMLFCPYGSVTIFLNNGENEEEILLDNPNIGIILKPGLWRDMRWNIDNSVLCVAASQYYDENDYIRDYDEYLEYIKNDKKGEIK
ncbi:MAG: FdtA/QdtA family cupin domain-containing protein [Lachnospiraceae bacterium]|nr:FdtA/QdtA family cupin domain-containing protein [Lachnospiraceae bacterium]